MERENLANSTAEFVEQTVKSEGAKQLTARGGERVHWGDIRRFHKEGRSKTFHVGSGSDEGGRNCVKRDDG